MPCAPLCSTTFSIRSLIKASFSCSASTHTHCGLEYDVIFQAELIVSGVRFFLSGCSRTLLCYTMRPQIPGKALMKSYERLDASWLWREGRREDRERWKMGVKHRGMKWGMWRRGKHREEGRWIEGKKGGFEQRLDILWGPFKPNCWLNSTQFSSATAVQHFNNSHTFYPTWRPWFFLVGNRKCYFILFKTKPLQLLWGEMTGPL